MIPGIDLLPDDIKQDFENLTMVEEMLISPIIPIMSIHRLQGGAMIQRGYVANFKQDIQPILKELPRLAKDLPILILKKVNQQNQESRFKINRNRVQRVLTYLCQHNKQWVDNGIHINFQSLNSLPIDDVPSDLNNIILPDELIDSVIIPEGAQMQNLSQNPQNTHIDQDFQAYIETSQDKPLEIDYMKNIIQFPRQDPVPINEFEYDGLCSMVFPKLFPNGAGDPTKKSKKL